MTLCCHREINFITCVCSYLGTDHSCNHVINGNITIRPCLDDCKVCQEEVDKREYYDLKQQQNEDRYIVCGVCRGNLVCQAICENCFCTRCKKEKGYSSCECDLG